MEGRYHPTFFQFLGWGGRGPVLVGQLLPLDRICPEETWCQAAWLSQEQLRPPDGLSLLGA